MLAEERYEAILERIQTAQYVKAVELASLFGVSLETVRRDLFQLESRGLLTRIHGGAAAPARISELHALDQRMQLQTEEKSRIAHLAVSLLRENDSIAVDSGSTATAFARVLCTRRIKLTVITHSLHVFHILRDNPDFKLILVGGEYLHTEDAFYGTLAEGTIRSLRVSKCFICPSGISLAHGVTDYFMELLPIQKAYLGIAQQAVFMADSSKFETSALIKVSDMDARHIYITDEQLDAALTHEYARHNIRLLVASADESVGTAEEV